MWKYMLDEIQEIGKEFDDELIPPASDKEIDALKQNTKGKFETDLPEQYIRFLQTVNGLYYNGLTIYGVDSSLLQEKPVDPVYGFIDTNEIWRESEGQEKYLFFGDSDISWYCLNLSNGAYELRDKPSGTVMETFGDFDSMIESALKTSLL